MRRSRAGFRGTALSEVSFEAQRDRRIDQRNSVVADSSVHQKLFAIRCNLEST
jgi:hypothetical protein